MAIAVVKDDEVILARDFGLADVENNWKQNRALRFGRIQRERRKQLPTSAYFRVAELSLMRTTPKKLTEI